MEKKELLFQLLALCIGGERDSLITKNTLTIEELEAVYLASAKQDVSHIICNALERNGLLPDDDRITEAFCQQRLLAIYRYQRTNFEYERICQTLRKAEIPYLPLKGSVIREYYPEPWMRTSCDIDILVAEEKLEAAVKALRDELNYATDGAREFHDVSLHSPTGIHLELHFNILENLPGIDKMLCKVWDHSAKREGSEYEYRMTNEFLIFHVLAHMSYHFIGGGCGIRPFIDLWLLREKLQYDENMLLTMCKECGLERFYNAVSELAYVWFGGKVHSELSLSIESFILNGGVYGDPRIGIAARQSKKGGKLSYAMSRIFQPYDVLKEKYPILKKHRFLTPFYEVKRWFDLVLRGKLKSSYKELEANNSVSRKQASEAAEFLSKLGL